MARRLTTNQEIVGSNPIVVNNFLLVVLTSEVYLLFSAGEGSETSEFQPDPTEFDSGFAPGSNINLVRKQTKDKIGYRQTSWRDYR